MTGTMHIQRQGSTRPIAFLLLHGSDPYPLHSVTAVQLRLVPHIPGPTLVFDLPDPQLAITDAAAGEITFYPDVDTLSYDARAYHVYFWVTDADGYIISFPPADTFLLHVVDNP